MIKEIVKVIIYVIIVEDNIDDANALKNCINQYGEEFLSDYKKGVFDIVFMDIMMGTINGLDTCRELRKVDTSIIIIFLTNLAQYAINGYEVGALDFVLKPINYNVLSMKLNRALKIINDKNKTMCISFSYQNEVFFLEASEIQYVEITGHKLIFYTAKKIYCTYELSLSKVEDIFSKNGLDNFCRCNNYLLVNLNYMTSLSNCTIKIGEKELLVSRSKKKQLMERISKIYSQGSYK